MKKRHLLIPVILLLSFFINILNAGENIEKYTLKSKSYKGLIINIEKSSFSNMILLYEEYKNLFQEDKIQPLRTEYILKKLESRFKEMVIRVKNSNDNLPKCLKRALVCFFEKLKNGEETLEIAWSITLDPAVIDSYRLLDKQRDCADGKWFPRQTKRIVVSNAFEELCGAVYQEEGKVIYRKNIFTASVIFHELLHLIRWKYHPRCLKTFLDKNISLEEAICEDGTWSVFGKANTLQYYEKVMGYPHCNGCDKSKNDCTQKNVCTSACCEECEEFVEQ